jgi:heme/copper-type cytochrome/quinol oxidase subunit 2
MFKQFRFAVFGGILTAAALVALAGCGSAGNGSANENVSKQQGQAVTIHYQIVAPDDALAKVGTDGNTHDTFWALDATTVHVGDIVTISVANYDDVPHGMTFPSLGISKELAAGTDAGPTVTTFTFTANKAGTFRWFCPIPCDTDTKGWAMKASPNGPGQEGFMAGSMTVLQ